ncbi:MAG: NAD(+)/NADH kinase [Ruminococcus sp.]|nr:NAD(+)/NADH kinase [Oscillospiraceae bacterium]MDY4414189.1 NAD(+)/NADH kinase [Ruminococcus sp.]
MRVAVNFNPEKNNAPECAEKVCEILLKDGAEVSVNPAYKERFSKYKNIIFEPLSESAEKSDFAVAIGGDGTMLRCAKKIIGCNAKMIGINTGRLGFMASLESDCLEKLLLLKSGQFEITERMLLHGILHDETRIYEFDALNDINVSGMYSKICDFSLYSGNYQLGNYRADGIIFSTPTGSTAYALSAGGPVIEPDLECIEMNLICPHSLFSRAMLFSPERTLTLLCKSSSEESPLYMSFDGETPLKVSSNSRIEISKSRYKIPFVDFESKNAFHESLSKKLMQSIK